MIDRWPFRHGTALGIGLLVLLTVIVAGMLRVGAGRALPIGYAPAGEYSFVEHCAACHGFYGAGTPAGPELAGAGGAPMGVDALARTIREGVGEMPPIDGLADQELADVVAFVRDLRAGS